MCSWGPSQIVMVPIAWSLGSRMPQDPCGCRGGKEEDWIGGSLWGAEKIGGHFSEESSVGKRSGNVRGGSVALQQAIKKKLALSPGESWACCSLALLTPCVPLFLPCLVKWLPQGSSQTTFIAQSLSSISPSPSRSVSLAMLDGLLRVGAVFSALFTASKSCGAVLAWPAPCRGEGKKEPVGGKR